MIREDLFSASFSILSGAFTSYSYSYSGDLLRSTPSSSVTLRADPTKNSANIARLPLLKTSAWARDQKSSIVLPPNPGIVSSGANFPIFNGFLARQWLGVLSRFVRLAKFLPHEPQSPTHTLHNHFRLRGA
jgi:hypothetical protein